MAMMNRKLEPRPGNSVHAAGRFSTAILSSRLVREIAQLGGSVNGLVPPAVEQRLRAKVV